jgi:regulator of RNase E activity RraA
MDADIKATLTAISTATITTVLLKKGLRNVWLRGAFPKQPGQQRVVGIAFTLRFVPAREDLATPASWASPISTRTAIEAMDEGVIAVADAMGVTDAGIFGDILCARMAKRKVGALITDGVMRDMEGVLATGLPVWCAGAAAPASVASLTFVNWQQPIACAGVAIFPGHTIVAAGERGWDPRHAGRESRAGRRTGNPGSLDHQRSAQGVPRRALYPPNDKNKTDAAWRKPKGAYAALRLSGVRKASAARGPVSAKDRYP